MPEKISIRTITDKGHPALQIYMQTVNAAGGVLSLCTLNGSLLRLVALPEGTSVISLQKITQPSICIKIETGHHTLLREITVGVSGREIIV